MNRISPFFSFESSFIGEHLTGGMKFYSQRDPFYIKSEGPLSLSTLMEESEICTSNDHFRISLQKCNDEKALTPLSNGPHSKTPHLNLENGEYNAKMEELQLQLDKVRMMVRPGCSQEVLDVALASMASLVKTLSIMSTSEPHLHASL